MGIARARLGHRVSGVKNETMPVFRAGLDALFLPDSVAVIGATDRPGTVGRTVLENLLASLVSGQGICRQFTPRGSLWVEGLPERLATFPTQ